MTSDHHDARLPLVAARDFRALALWSLGWGVIAPLPARAIAPMLGALTRLNHGRVLDKARRLAPTMAEVLGPHLPGADFRELARVYYEAKLEERMGVWWSLHGRRWPLAIEVESRHHLHTALGAGRGAILWGMEFGGVLTRKCALRQLGLPLVHLRGSLHGAPDPPTRFGLRTVAALQCRAEDIYLEDCVMVGPNAPPGGAPPPRAAPRSQPLCLDQRRRRGRPDDAPGATARGSNAGCPPARRCSRPGAIRRSSRADSSGSVFARIGWFSRSRSRSSRASTNAPSPPRRCDDSLPWSSRRFYAIRRAGTGRLTGSMQRSRLARRPGEPVRSRRRRREALTPTPRGR